MIVDRNDAGLDWRIDAAKDIADFILVGREGEIRRLAAEQGVTGGFTVINEEDDNGGCEILTLIFAQARFEPIFGRASPFRASG